VARFVCGLYKPHWRATGLTRYHPTSYMLRARPGGTHGPPGASESFGRPYQDRASSHDLALTGVFR
jgi:hypothetical protein